MSPEEQFHAFMVNPASGALLDRLLEETSAEAEQRRKDDAYMRWMRSFHANPEPRKEVP